MNHVLKAHSHHFARVWDGDKTFEIRADDRVPRFAEGDRVYLVEWDPDRDAELPRWVATRIACIVRGPAHGLAAGHAVLGLDPSILACSGRFSESGTAARLGEQSHTPGSDREVA